jgi:hypothetical protein
MHACGIVSQLMGSGKEPNEFLLTCIQKLSCWWHSPLQRGLRGVCPNAYAASEDL